MRDMSLGGLLYNEQFIAAASLISLSLSCPQEMMAAFEAEGKSTNRPRLMLTAAVSAGKGTIETAYQIAEIGK